jgi:hypothetical protein
MEAPRLREIPLQRGRFFARRLWKSLIQFAHHAVTYPVKLKARIGAFHFVRRVSFEGSPAQQLHLGFQPYLLVAALRTTFFPPKRLRLYRDFFMRGSKSGIRGG